MPKILAQAGISLADVYNVEGSVAGTDELLSKEVSLVHEMGGQILSERLLTHTINIETAALLQNVDYRILFSNLPDCPNRIVSVIVAADVPARVLHATVCVSPVTSGSDAVLWNHTGAVDGDYELRMEDSGVVVNLVGLDPHFSFVPFLVTRAGDEALMPQVILSGRTTGFGAGDVSVQAFVTVIRAQRNNPAAGEPTSHGLPIPSW